MESYYSRWWISLQESSRQVSPELLEKMLELNLVQNWKQEPAQDLGSQTAVQQRKRANALRSAGNTARLLLPAPTKT